MGACSSDAPPARQSGQSNGFRLRCRVGALFQQTDASPTIIWCLVMIYMVKLMWCDRTGRAKTEYSRSGTKLCTARTGGRSNGFRLRCRVGALFRQTDAFPTTRCYLMMIPMVKLMRCDRTGRAKTEYSRSGTKLCTARMGGLSNGFRLRCRV